MKPSFKRMFQAPANCSGDIPMAMKPVRLVYETSFLYHLLQSWSKYYQVLHVFTLSSR